jgi:hypothetical protein
MGKGATAGRYGHREALGAVPIDFAQGWPIGSE